MTFPSPFHHHPALKIPASLPLAFLILQLASCHRPPAAAATKPDPVIARELTVNQLASGPGPLLKSETNAPIHWQNPDPETLRRAADAQRPVFAFIGAPQIPLTHTALAAIYSNNALVETINHDFVPVMIDIDVCREFGLLTVPLCSEQNKPTSLPLMLWLTSEGNPIAWLPVNNQNPGQIVDIVSNAANMVSQMWTDSPEYVMKNSRLDNDARRKRLSANAIIPVDQTSPNPLSDTTAAIRQLSVLYDTTTRNFDGSGGLFPSSALKLLAQASCYKELPPFARDAARKTIRDLGDELAASAMIDPLDGGIFLNRIGMGWNLPVFQRGCAQEALAANSWLQAGHAIQNPTYIAIGLAVLRFAENSYSTGDGLFSMGYNSENTKPSDWLWSEEAIRSALTPEEAKVFCAECDINSLGNIPPECDPTRETFRLNSLAIRKPTAQVATTLGLPAESATTLFQSSCRKLLKIRSERLGNTTRDNVPHAASTFRMISAYSTAWTVTGDPVWRNKALRAIQKAKVSFAEGNRLRYEANHPGEGQNAARAFIYGLGINASLDVADITLDPAWASWAEDLASTASEHFTDQTGALEECPKHSRFINLPAIDRTMIFDESSAGLLSIAEARLPRMGRLVTTDLTATVTPLHISVPSKPILHTDILESYLIRLFSPVIILATDAPDDLKLAVSRLPAGSIPRAVATFNTINPPPSGKARVTLPDKSEHIVATATELSAILEKVF